VVARQALGTSERFRMNLQSRYDLDIAVSKHRTELDQIRRLSAQPAGSSASDTVRQ